MGLVPWPRSVTQLNRLDSLAAGAVGTNSDTEQALSIGPGEVLVHVAAQLYSELHRNTIY